MTPPLHATSATVPPTYFWPPSRPESPILALTAFFDGVSYPFQRAAMGEPWILQS